MKLKIIETISSIIKICDTFVRDEFNLLILSPSQRPNTRYKRVNAEKDQNTKKSNLKTRYKTKKNEKRKTLNKIFMKNNFITNSYYQRKYRQ